MSDLISRKAAIDALQKEINKAIPPFDDVIGAIRCGVRLARNIVEDEPTIDAVPLDGSFLKMSKGDYLIYNRHWLYEHFDQEMDIQRSVMKSMGYEPALKDAEPHWIPVSERLPKGERK